MALLISRIAQRLKAAKPSWVRMVGAKPIVMHKGQELTVRMHDIYFINEHYIRTGKSAQDFQQLDVDREPFFDIVVAAREGELKAIEFLRRMMNNLNEWGLYGETPAEFKEQPAGIPLPGAAGFHRASDHNILVTCGLLKAEIPPTDFQQLINGARAGNLNDALRLRTLNITIAEFYAGLTSGRGPQLTGSN